MATEMRVTVISSAVVAALLAGCMMGPDYVRPKVDTPAAFRFEPKVVADAANTEWWKQFNDPVLDALIAEALANNVNVKIAAANVEQAAAILTQTRSQLFPQVGFNVSGQRVRSTDVGATPELERLIPNPQTAYQAVLTASWELDLWGRIRRLSESARANALASDDARRGVILSLVASVANDYIQLRGLDAQLAIARSTLGTYDESVKLFELQFKYGQVSQMNVAQAQSQYENAAAQIPQIESQIAQTENALSVLLGRNPGPIARGKSLHAMVLPQVPEGLPSQLLERRPDLMQSEEELVAANAQIGAAKALYFPTISLTGAFGSASADLSKLFTGPARVWSYAGQLTGPIFSFGAVSGQVAQAEAAAKAALLNYQLSIQNAFADVDNALVANQKLQEQLSAQTRLVAALQDYSRLARLQFTGGYTSYSTVLQAEQSLFPAELTLASVRAQMFASSVNIYKSMGGGWVNIADKSTPGWTRSETVIPKPDALPPLF
jgi:multidrug efflux system outer membrane protein